MELGGRRLVPKAPFEQYRPTETTANFGPLTTREGQYAGRRRMFPESPILAINRPTSKWLRCNAVPWTSAMGLKGVSEVDRSQARVPGQTGPSPRFSRMHL